MGPDSSVTLKLTVMYSNGIAMAVILQFNVNVNPCAWTSESILPTVAENAEKLLRNFITNTTTALTLIDREQHDTTVTFVYRDVTLPTMSADTGKPGPWLCWSP